MSAKNNHIFTTLMIAQDLLKEADKALEAFGNEASAWIEMGNTRPIMGPESPLTVAHLREASRVLVKLRNFKPIRRKK